jgi:hypothetical protein
MFFPLQAQRCDALSETWISNESSVDLVRHRMDGWVDLKLQINAAQNLILE